MKLEVIQEKFAKALIHVNKAVSNRPNIPVLANVLLETDQGYLKLSATNLEIGVIAKIGADIHSEGKITVSARLLSEFVNSLKPGKLSLEIEKSMLMVKSVDNSAEFYVIPADDFPTVPHAEGDALLKINALKFSEALEKTTFAAATDNSRPVLTGLLTRITKRTLTLVGVDGFRLSQKVIDIDGPDKDFKEIIPAKSLQEIARIIRDVATAKDDVEIYNQESNNQIIFKIGDVQLASRLIEGEFPNFEDIIPQEKQVSFDVAKDDLANGVKIVSIFARNVVGNKTRFTVEPDEGKLKLMAEVQDMGTNETLIEITKPVGEKMETAYNAKFMQDMLNSMDGEELIYETSGAASPGVFKDKKDTDYLHIIMPMRLE